ncbi:MAG: GNAT family N-acetyltransferase [Dokdonella sp.]
MSAQEPPELHIRLARADDDEFIVGLAPRFAEFDLPAWRKQKDVIRWIHDDLLRTASNLPPGSHLFIAENADYQPVGLLHIQTMTDAFSDALNCHISDLACAPGYDGQGIGSALLAHAEAWAKEHRCRHLTLAVFPGNERGRAMYERHGFGIELHRMVKKLG